MIRPALSLPGVRFALLFGVLVVSVAVPSTAFADGQAVVNAAASQAGKPYCWDGGNEHGPTHGTGGSGCPGSTVGFDCTGLAIYAVYQGTGISGLPHDGEGNRWAAKGIRINDQSQLQPGDIVFFGGSFSSFEHAAIYGGGGMTWDADDFNVPVQQHSLAWIEHGLPFVGAVRFSGSGGVAPTVTDGTFVSNSGFVYRIAGGAPIYVSSWNAVGGPQPTTALSNAQFAALPQYPADGSLISSTATGMVYEIAGGAPLYVSNWNAIGGARPSVGVDQAAIDNADGGTPWNHLHRYPADGSLISSTATGMVYEIAGGAPLYVSNWNAIGGARPSVGVDQAAIDNADGGTPWNHLHRYPADGSLISSTATGMVYEIAGGAPLYVSNWNAIGGARPSVGVDQAAIDNADGGTPWNHLHRYPADGSLISSTATGMVYEIAGGAPLYVSNWNAIGGARPSVGVDQAAIDNADGGTPWNHLHRYPADGTFVNSSTGHVYRVAGGALFGLSNWAVLGGIQHYTTIDQWDVDHVGAVASHLRTYPLDGTIVRGRPSGQLWGFAQGLRHRTASGSPSTDVDDAGVAAYSEAPTGDGTPTGAGGGTLANPGTPPANGATAIKFATWRAVLSKHGRRTRYSLMAGHAYSYCGSYRLSELDAYLRTSGPTNVPVRELWSVNGRLRDKFADTSLAGVGRYVGIVSTRGLPGGNWFLVVTSPTGKRIGSSRVTLTRRRGC